ncbi:exodeoxyribonuclease III [Corynebacterium uterequi]|nr:exodeoxyribonuclease III [Corynebacterium uterequi]
MRIATWNVNSVRTRADRVTGFLARHDVDVLAMQETKCSDDKFPYLAFEEAGYEVAHVGYHQYNGVAIASRVGLSDVADHFPGQPGFAKDPQKPQHREARAVGATCGGVRLWSLYVPNGRQIGDRHYDYKLAFYYALARFCEQETTDPARRFAIMGDFNVAPRDEDVWDMAAFAGATHVTEPERAAFQMVEESGLREVTRSLAAQRYTYWDYKAGRFGKDEGMRIDFQFASAPLAATARAAFVDVKERAQAGASDHAPVVVDYQEAADYDSVR